MLFLLQVCKDFSKPCFKRNTKNGYKDLMNYFTYKVFSNEIHYGKIKGRQTPSYKATFAKNNFYKVFFRFNSLEGNCIIKAKFLIEQLHFLLKQNQGQRYGAVMM